MLRFLQISDTHISADANYHPPWVHPSILHPNIYVERLISTINQLPFDFDFVLHTGDVCANDTMQNYFVARDLFCRLKKPLYMVAGNHDSVDYLTSIMHDGCHLHVLQDDCIQIEDYHLITVNSQGVGDAHAPCLLDEQLDWLGQELAQVHLPVIMALHHPIAVTGVDWIDRDMRIQNGVAIHRLLRQNISCVRGVFHGHIHQPSQSYLDGILYASCPSTWYNLQGHPDVTQDTADLMTAGGFNLVTVDAYGTFIRPYTI